MEETATEFHTPNIEMMDVNGYDHEIRSSDDEEGTVNEEKNFNSSKFNSSLIVTHQKENEDACC